MTAKSCHVPQQSVCLCVYGDIVSDALGKKCHGRKERKNLNWTEPNRNEMKLQAHSPNYRLNTIVV